LRGGVHGVDFIPRNGSWGSVPMVIFVNSFLSNVM
jgi:hypothetical protein